MINDSRKVEYPVNLDIVPLTAMKRPYFDKDFYQIQLDDHVKQESMAVKLNGSDPLDNPTFMELMLNSGNTSAVKSILGADYNVCNSSD